MHMCQPQQLQPYAVYGQPVASRVAVEAPGTGAGVRVARHLLKTINLYSGWLQPRQASCVD